MLTKIDLRSVAWTTAAGALVAIALMHADAARAGDDFERGFKNELGRIAAHEAVSAGLHVLGGILHPVYAHHGYGQRRWHARPHRIHRRHRHHYHPGHARPHSRAHRSYGRPCDYDDYEHYERHRGGEYEGYERYTRGRPPWHQGY